MRLGGETIDFSDWRVGESNKFDMGESMADKKTYNYNPCTVAFDVVPTEPEKDELVEALTEIDQETDDIADYDEAVAAIAGKLRERFDIKPKAQPPKPEPKPKSQPPKPEPKPKTVGQQIADEAKAECNARIDARVIPDDLDSIIAGKIDEALKARFGADTTSVREVYNAGRRDGIIECREVLQRFCVDNFIAMQAIGPQSYYTYTAAAAIALDGVK